jgi:hypothetical protein
MMYLNKYQLSFWIPVLTVLLTDGLSHWIRTTITHFLSMLTFLRFSYQRARKKTTCTFCVWYCYCYVSMMTYERFSVSVLSKVRRQFPWKLNCQISAPEYMCSSDYLISTNESELIIITFRLYNCCVTCYLARRVRAIKFLKTVF